MSTEGVFWRGERPDGVAIELAFANDKDVIIASVIGPLEDNPAVEALSDSFSRILAQWLSGRDQRLPGLPPGETTLDEVRRRNRRTYPRGCASGDFCDSNMAMDEAWTRTFEERLDINNDDQVDLWNDAWTLSSRREFRPRVLQRTYGLEQWMKWPTFGVNHRGEDLLLTKDELSQILVALDYFMETGKMLR